MTLGRFIFELRVILPRNLELRGLADTLRDKARIVFVTLFMFAKYCVPALPQRPARLTLGSWGTVWVNDWSELRVAHEVFCDRIYDVKGLPEEARVIVDLGANIGLASMYFRARYPDAEIVAYEADPDVAARARRNLQHLPRVTVHTAAVSDSGDGTVSLRRQPGRSWSTSIHGTVGEVFEVETRTFDSIIAETGGATVVKMDIEGAEHAVLRTAQNLDRADFIIGEVHPVAGVSGADVLRFLGGFELLDKQMEPDGTGVFLARRRLKAPSTP